MRIALDKKAGELQEHLREIHLNDRFLRQELLSGAQQV